MAYEKSKMAVRKRIALIAHNARKEDLLAWVKFNKDLLGRHILLATRTRGNLVSKETGLFY